MSFRENLLTKTAIDRAAENIIASIRPVGDIHKIDRESMVYLLTFAEYAFERRRDLDLYYKDEDGDKKRILVLDNDLAIYHTTIDDVVIRKSPYVKEMISLRNVIKILNDTDVVVSKKAASVRAIQNECISRLDLAFNETDLEEIAQSGVDAVAVADAEAVAEAVSLFAEILGYEKPPKKFIARGQMVLSRLTLTEDDTRLHGPILLYNAEENRIKLVNDQIKVTETAKIDRLHKIASGMAKPDMEGGEVFDFLKQEARKIKTIRS